ncbi:cyclin domain containing protein, putative [Eimeria mitis]|uniref:Cyclin domain containing protein, putative n=1 Tax=Eimeria mitis TaxID=44415 RepID=U6K5D6_9EIME|nr:cyclin domain containing protein, putative [Eimeria mitis]CDJ32970.1 cyclin domain containing protein, putative [Eimeria mitis]
MATAKHSPVVATGSAEADFHSPLVAECSLLQSSDCSSHVPCLLGEVPSSPSRERQPSLEPKPLPTPPVSSVQEKVEAGGHSERETATTAAATPPVSHAGVPPIAEKVRKTETHPGRSISNTSGRVEPNVVASSQKRVQPPQTPGFVGKVYQNCREPTSEYEDVEENTEALALLRHSEVSFVCVRALVSFLASCCTVSHFGSDERLQQANDLSTSPFHCSSRPHIGLEEYLVKRIFRHGKQTINEGVMAVALLSRFLCKQNALLSAALRENSHQQRLQQHLDSCSRDATVRDKDARHGSAIARATSATEGFSATAARIGYIEFNYLTAHRLLLTAAFLARKTHRDDHTSIRHWAQLGGVPVEDLVEAESAFVQVVEWRVQVTLDEFFSTALAISLGDPRLLAKQGELQPVRGNPATTAVYVREHALLLQQQADLTTPTTLRGLQAQEQLHQKTALDKMQLQQTEEVLTCCMCFSCCMLQPGQVKQRNVGLPFADVAPPEGLASSQVENDVLNKSEPIGFPLSSTSKQFRETARYSLKTGSKVGPLDLPQSPSGDENLSTTDATQAPTMWKLSRALNQHECTARSTACAADDCSHSPSASVKPHDTSSCVLQEDILQSKGRRHFKAYPLRTFKKEETKVPAAHTNLRAGLAPTQ